jgi:hypothetical protein
MLMSISLAYALQKAYRAHVRLVAAYMRFDLRRREVMNPYNSVDSIAGVVRRCLREGLRVYHPENEQLNMRLAAWLRRLGAYDVWPLFKACKSGGEE